MALKETEEFKNLAEKISEFPSVNQHDTKEQPHGWSIAIGVQDIEEICRKVSCEVIPQLKSVRTEEEFIEVMTEFGEDIRHFIYHAKEIRFFDYIFPPNK